jgi:hypothetical protein
MPWLRRLSLRDEVWGLSVQEIVISCAKSATLRIYIFYDAMKNIFFRQF